MVRMTVGLLFSMVFGTDDPGWYKHPTGTVALRAKDEELRHSL
jgi:hypothetical protein